MNQTSSLIAVARRITRRCILLLLVGVASTAPGLAQPPTGDPDAVYDTLLSRYVQASPDGVNRVDYARWKANKADKASLDAYIVEMSSRKPSAMTRDDALSYWGNLYNAVTLKLILDRYPVTSIRDIKSSGSWFDFKAYTGPWRELRVTVEGKKLSLDDIEHDVMRPTFKDPRVHYVVNCASFGCPNLMARAWRARTLEADLDQAARAFINHPRAVEVLAGNKLRVSSIYKWFRDDFGPDDAAVIAHLKKFANPNLAAKLDKVASIAEDQYDWALNSTKP